MTISSKWILTENSETVNRAYFMCVDMCVSGWSRIGYIMIKTEYFPAPELLWLILWVVTICPVFHKKDAFTTTTQSGSFQPHPRSLDRTSGREQDDFSMRNRIAWHPCGMYKEMLLIRDNSTGLSRVISHSASGYLIQALLS